MKTEEEIEQLKQRWLKNPNWDIYKTKGFEAHEEELRDFQQKQYLIWEVEKREMAEK